MIVNLSAPQVRIFVNPTGSIASPSVLYDAIQFLRREWKRVLIASLVVLIPCFWQKHIESCDLPSHSYNIWLIQLVHSGRAPGLYLVPQYSNVLFDWILEGSIALFGFGYGEKIAAAAAVLLFFWSLFAFCSAAAEKPAWNVTPWIAILTYGWMFAMGFINCYLSVAFAFLVFAIIWKGRKWDLLALLPLAILLWLAHPLGSATAVGLSIYLAIVRRSTIKLQAVLTVVTFAVVCIICRIATLYVHNIPEDRIYPWLLGGDQFILYRSTYAFVVIAWLLLISASPVIQRKQLSKVNWIWLLTLILVFLSVKVLPEAIYTTGKGPMGYLPERFSIFTAALGCVWLATLKTAKWQLVVYSSVAILFFALLFRDARFVNQMEDAVSAQVQKLPAGTRVIPYFDITPSRVSISHILDRACIGHCYSYGNYEAPFAQFRLRARPGNPIVTDNWEDSFNMETGKYLPKPSDLPLYVVYRCGPRPENICMDEIQKLIQR
jgi:hypothetical protein